MPGLKLQILIGERFKIGARYFTLRQVKGPTTVILELEGSMTQQFEVTDHPRGTEVLPGVKIHTLKSDRSHRATIVIEAPKEVRIERLQKTPDERFAPSI